MDSPKMVSRKELEDQIHRKRTGKSIMQGIIDAQKVEIERLLAGLERMKRTAEAQGPSGVPLGHAGRPLDWHGWMLESVCDLLPPSPTEPQKGGA